MGCESIFPRVTLYTLETCNTFSDKWISWSAGTPPKDLREYLGRIRLESSLPVIRRSLETHFWDVLMLIIISFLLLTLDFMCSFFNFLSWILRSFFFSNICYTFSPMHCFHCLPWILIAIFILILLKINFSSPLTHIIEIHCLYIYGFSCYLSTTDFQFNYLWAESRHWMIYICLNLLRYILWSIMWPILVNIPYELDRNVYYAVVGSSLCCCCCCC